MWFGRDLRSFSEYLLLAGSFGKDAVVHSLVEVGTNQARALVPTSIIKDVVKNESISPVATPLEAASQVEAVGPVVDESRTSPEIGGKKGEDAPLDEIQCWIPEFTRLAPRALTKSLSFLGVENNELILNVALGLEHDCTMSKNMDLLKGSLLKGIYGRMMCICMGLVAAIPRALERGKP